MLNNLEDTRQQTSRSTGPVAGRTRSQRWICVPLLAAVGVLPWAGANCDSLLPFPGNPQTDNGNRGDLSLLDRLLSRMPNDDVVLRTVAPAADGPSDALVSFGYTGLQGNFTAYLRGNAEEIRGLLLVDDSGPILEQSFRFQGREVRFVTGDSFSVENSDSGLVLTLEFAATDPPSRVVFRLDAATDGVVLDEQASWIGSELNAAYGSPVQLLKPRAPGFKDRHEQCDLVQQVVEATIEKVCEALQSPYDELSHKAAQACNKVGEYIVEEAKRANLPEDLIQRLEASKSFVCRGVEIVGTRGKFFSRLKPMDWPCLAYTAGQELAVIVQGKTIGEIICDKLYPPCGPGTIEGPNGECTPIGPIVPRDPPDPTPLPTSCPPGQTVDINGRCVCPNGYPADLNGNCCPAGMYPDPTNGNQCGCLDGGPPDPITGICTCPAGKHRDPATGACIGCPDGEFPGGAACDESDPNCCITCELAWQTYLERGNRLVYESGQQAAYRGYLASCLAWASAGGPPCVDAVALQNSIDAIQVTIDQLLADINDLLNSMYTNSCPQLPPIGP